MVFPQHGLARGTGQVRHDCLRYRRRGDDGKAIDFLGGECCGQIMGERFQEIALGVFLRAVILAVTFHGAALRRTGAGKGAAWLVLAQFGITRSPDRQDSPLRAARAALSCA